MLRICGSDWIKWLWVLSSRRKHMLLVEALGTEKQKELCFYRDIYRVVLNYFTTKPNVTDDPLCQFVFVT
jgi:hypothetical protein